MNYNKQKMIPLSGAHIAGVYRVKEIFQIGKIYKIKFSRKGEINFIKVLGYETSYNDKDIILVDLFDENGITQKEEDKSTAFHVYGITHEVIINDIKGIFNEDRR